MHPPLAPGQRMQFCPSCSLETIHAPMASGLMACLRCHFMAEQAAAAAFHRQQAMQVIHPGYAPQQQRVVYVHAPSSGGSFLGGILKAMIAIVLLGVLGVVCIGFALQSKKDKEEETVQSATGADILDVTAKQLEKDYAANEVRADGKYKGRVLRVTGVLEDISKDLLDDPYISIRAGNDFTSVTCSFNKEDGLASLRKGQKITVRGIGDGYLLGPRMVACQLE